MANYVYRLLNKQDKKNISEGKGIYAKKPAEQKGLAAFINAGGADNYSGSQFIATMLVVYRAVFFSKSTKNPNVVRIDLDKCPGTLIYDCSTPSKALSTIVQSIPAGQATKGYVDKLVSWASTRSEIDVVGHIPAEAIEKFDVGACLSDAENARNYAMFLSRNRKLLG